MHRSFSALVAVSGLLLLAGCASGGSSKLTGGPGSQDAGPDTSIDGNASDGGIHIETGTGNDATTGCHSTCQELGANCGAVTDTKCGGVVQCGSCATGEVCGAGGPNKCGTGDAGQCTPKTCADLGANCGKVLDGCGKLIDCGTCEGGMGCGVNQPNVCGTVVPEGGLCVPKTCASQNISCGPAGDGCGGTLNCGTCTAPDTCGGGGVQGQCGAAACQKLTCAGQNVSCGPASDGCGGVLNCGTCTLPKTCGGDPNKPGQCGCTGVCSQIPNCSGGQTTTLTGSVYDPAGHHPLYNALVYIPNKPSDPGLQPFQPGISCDVCGASAAGDPLITTHTAVNGTFTLSGVPVGQNIMLVIQLGRWRRIFHVNITNSCGANVVSGTNVGANGKLTMPANHNQGDIPRIAILTGGFDPIECVLRKMGIQDSEFTNPGGAGHIQLYRAAQPNRPSEFGIYSGVCPANPFGSGAVINASTPPQTSLFASTNGTPNIDQYDMVLLPCEGYEVNNQADWPNLGAYTAAGGRVFMSDFAYDWMAQTKPTTSCNNSNQCGAGGTCEKPAGPPGYCTSPNDVTENPAYAGVATWQTAQDPAGSALTATIDLTSNPKGQAFEQWLQIVGASVPGSGTVSLNPVYHNSDAVTSPTQQWLYRGTGSSGAPVHFTFNTPVGVPAAQQCGRAVFSDWHADNLGFSNASNYPNCPYILPTTAPYYSHGMTFPQECDSKPMTHQEEILEFMLFDLSACVQPYQPLCTPETCAQQNISCGPAGDGCGNLIQCGGCTAPQTCGGAGKAGQCGTPPTCTPETCAQQNISCGPAGDGCGNLIQCGPCTAPKTCGGGGVPGQCGAPDGGTCTPETCAQQNIACGPAGNGCGGTLDCGPCTAPKTCGGGGVPGQCGSPTCTPETCSQQNISCGPAGDGCGGTLDCGNCPAGQICGLNKAGQCGALH